MPERILAHNRGHFMLLPKSQFHFKCIDRIILCWIVHIFRNGDIFVVFSWDFGYRQATVSERFPNVHNGVEEVLFFYRASDDSVGSDTWVPVDLDVASHFLLYLCRFVFGFLLFVDYVLNPKISILTKWIASRWWVFADAAFVVERVAYFELIALS